jgi:hypothetical protein
MPKLSSRLGFLGHFPDSFSFATSIENHTKEIEHRYGHALPLKAWAKVLIATELFLLSSQAEDQLMSISDLKTALAATREHAQRLKEKLSNDDANGIRPVMISNLDELVVIELLLALEQVVRKSKALEDLVSDSDYQGFQVGGAWQHWTISLASILKEHGLPYQVRKDVDKQKPGSAISPFVKLVDSLQRLLPEKVRRHTQSLDALSQALVRGRKGIELEMKFFDQFGPTAEMLPWLIEMKKRFG